MAYGNTSNLEPPKRPELFLPITTTNSDGGNTTIRPSEVEIKWGNVNIKLWLEDQRDWRKQESYLGHLNTTITTSTNEDFLIFIKKSDTPREKLQALKAPFAPTGPAEQRKWENKYRESRQFERGQSTDAWLDEWSIPLPHFREIEVFEMGESKGYCRDFLETLHSRLPIFADSSILSYNQKLFNDGLATMGAMGRLIGLARQFDSTSTTVTASSSSPRGRIVNAAAVSQQTPETASDAGDDTNKTPPDPPVCLCGKPMWFYDCWYLVPPHLRPSSFRPDPVIQAQVDKKREEVPLHTKKSIKRAIEQREKGIPFELPQSHQPGGNQRPAKKPKTTGEPSKSKPPASEQPKVAAALIKRSEVSADYSGVERSDHGTYVNNLGASAANIVANSTSETPSEDQHDLHNSMLYENVANTEICNDIIRFTGFKETKEAVEAGGGDVITSRISTIEGTIDTPTGKRRFKFYGVGYSTSREPLCKSSRPFAVIHVDLHYFEVAYNGHHFGFLATCGVSNYHLASTSSTKRAIRDFLWGVVAIVKHQFGFDVLEIQTNGETTLDATFVSKAESKGNKELPDAAHFPAQNDGAERAGGVTKDRSKAMTIESRLPMKLWVYAWLTVIYLSNRTPCVKLNWATPIQYLRQTANTEPANRRKSVPWIGHFGVFGCKAFAHMHGVERVTSHMHGPRARSGYLVGYQAPNSWEIWLPQFNEVPIVEQGVPETDEVGVVFDYSQRGIALVRYAKASRTHSWTLKKRYMYVWQCCLCGQSGINIYADPCPRCNHPRCASCMTTRVRV